MPLTKLVSAEPVRDVAFPGPCWLCVVTVCLKPAERAGVGQHLFNFGPPASPADAPNERLELRTESRTYTVTLLVELTDTATVTQLPPKSLGTNMNGGGPIMGMSKFTIVLVPDESV